MRRCPATSGPSATGFASSRSSCWPRSAQASIWTATTANSAGLSRRSRSSPLTPRYGDANTPSPISDLPRKAVMTDTITKVREHYSATGLTDRIKSALARITPEGQTLTVAQLASLDQFHTRGILATAELAGAAGLEPSIRVLDLGYRCGHLSDSALWAVRSRRFPGRRRPACAFRGRGLRRGVPAARGDEYRGPRRPLCRGAPHLDAGRPACRLRPGVSGWRCCVSRPLGARHLDQLLAQRG